MTLTTERISATVQPSFKEEIVVNKWSRRNLYRHHLESRLSWKLIATALLAVAVPTVILAFL